MDPGPLGEVVVILAFSVVVVVAFNRLRLPSIVGFLFVGMTTGPHGLQWLQNDDLTRLLGDIGVAFLLFTIGLECSLSQLRTMNGALFGVGALQVLVGTACGALIAWALGIAWPGALIIGGALSLSSTAIVVKQLHEQMETQSRHGRLAFAILLFQDLAAVPFLAVIPILAGSHGETLGWAPLYALIKAAVAFAITWSLGHWVLRPLFHEVTGARAPDLFTLTVLLVSLAAAWVTSLLGLSLALGAFLSGAMLGETEFRHPIEADIRPFRDVLLGLFFVTVGMQLTIDLITPVWPWVLLVTSGLVLGKGLTVAMLTRLTGYDQSTALRTGMLLGQGGEFGIALLTVALGTGLLSAQSIQPVLAAIVLSMALAPLLIRHNGHLASRLLKHRSRRAGARREHEIAEAVPGVGGHVIICGFGRTGRHIANLLRAEGFSFVALDLDPTQIKEAWEAGERVFYGDAAQAHMLEAAGLKRARALVISFDDLQSALKVLHHVHEARPDLGVLVRARDDASLEQLLSAGASEGVPETFEASLMLAFQLLLLLEIPVGTIMRRIRAVHGSQYQLLQGVFREAAPGQDEAAERLREHLRSVTLHDGASAVGLRLKDLDLKRDGVIVTALRRDGMRLSRGHRDVILRAGDVLVLHGTPQQLKRSITRLLNGTNGTPG